MPVGPTSRIPLTGDWVARRNELAAQMEQAAAKACLFDCETEEERRFVNGRVAARRWRSASCSVSCEPTTAAVVSFTTAHFDPRFSTFQGIRPPRGAHVSPKASTRRRCHDSAG
jgi:hypothetical protein